VIVDAQTSPKRQKQSSHPGSPNVELLHFPQTCMQVHSPSPLFMPSDCGTLATQATNINNPSAFRRAE
jgi:hypothetical protein